MPLSHREEQLQDTSSSLTPAILNGVVVILVVWLVVSPFFLGYAATEAANDLHLVQIGAGVLIGVSALPRVRRPDAHPRLVLLALAAAALLLVAPWLLGAVYDDAAAGLPTGPADNGYAPLASANVVITAVMIIVATGAAAIAPRNGHGRRRLAALTGATSRRER